MFIGSFQQLTKQESIEADYAQSADKYENISSVFCFDSFPL